MLMSALSLGAYAVWLYVLHPPGQAHAVIRTTPNPRSSSSAVSPAAAVSAKAAEADATAAKIARGQELLASGDGKGALDVFKDALKGNTAVARSVLDALNRRLIG